MRRSQSVVNVVSARVTPDRSWATRPRLFVPRNAARRWTKSRSKTHRVFEMPLVCLTRARFVSFYVDNTRVAGRVGHGALL
jgi:hypothetical protein